ncbi:phosphate regulon transcriptional regulatory protein PhoB [Sesbania bispinosa]|nr:phosphate regulon transcriptional regulatory protein PhoB [Sesbania bispinosa]
MRKVGGATLQWLAAVVAAEMRYCASRRRRTIAKGDRLWPRRRLTDKGMDGLWCAAARGGDDRLWETVRGGQPQ